MYENTALTSLPASLFQGLVALENLWVFLTLAAAALTQGSLCVTINLFSRPCTWRLLACMGRTLDLSQFKEDAWIVLEAVCVVQRRILTCLPSASLVWIRYMLAWFVWMKRGVRRAVMRFFLLRSMFPTCRFDQTVHVHVCLERQKAFFFLHWIVWILFFNDNIT